jgi:uncharacterized repeat protein (TIGR03843 family)
MSEQDGKQPSKPLSLTVEKALRVLEHGEITNEHGLLRWSSNYAFVMTVTYDGVQVTAVYKPQKGERPLWDFPDGTLCYREMASFLTSQALGWALVPPTVLRLGSRGLGSFQLFIDHDPEINYFTFDESIHPQLMRMAAFDTIVNNADRKGGHCLLDEHGHLWGIDHGITFNAAHKLRTVIWDFAGQPVPAPILSDIEGLWASLCDSNAAYREELSRLLAPSEVNAFQRRIEKLLQSRQYPLPGPGPNYPWPPV